MQHPVRILSLLLFVSLYLVSCGGADDDQGPLEGNGNVTFYINRPLPCQEANITFRGPRGEVTGRLFGNRVFTGTPECSVQPSLSFMNRAYGAYTYQVECDDMIFGQNIMLREPCMLILVEMP
ncbi:hypothetical protein [Lunatimonas lonarensis]|nr:hypothetical protein [Lunatimonas lonarensis]